jgi:hypothetical protein
MEIIALKQIPYPGDICKDVNGTLKLGHRYLNVNINIIIISMESPCSNCFAS